MNHERVRAGYAVAVGAAMVGLWAVLFATGGVPELATAPAEVAFHLAAELLTALALLASGVGLLRGREWARRLHPVALGMLLYAAISAAGYYAGLGDDAAVGAFGVLIVATVAAVLDAVGRRERPAAAGQGGEPVA